MWASNRLMIAATAVAVIASTSPAFAIDPSREQQIRQTERYNERAQARPRGHVERTAPAPLQEPFTAAEKRAFQTPTGREIDRW